MRAPFQILVIPYQIVDGVPKYCVFHRADHDQWQFIAGGGEDNETPLEAAKRETIEEGGVRSDKWLELKSLISLLQSYPRSAVSIGTRIPMSFPNTLSALSAKKIYSYLTSILSVFG